MLAEFRAAATAGKMVVDLGTEVGSLEVQRSIHCQHHTAYFTNKNARFRLAPSRVGGRWTTYCEYPFGRRMQPEISMSAGTYSHPWPL